MVVVLDQLDLALAILQLETASLVDLIRPKAPDGEKGARRRWCKGTGFRADNSNFDGAAIRSCGAYEGCCQRGRARVFQQFTSSHDILPYDRKILAEGSGTAELKLRIFSQCEHYDRLILQNRRFDMRIASKVGLELRT